MLYCTYDTLNMFRALLRPSSGALDCMYAIAAYGVQCLAAGCQGQVQGSRVCVLDVRYAQHVSGTSVPIIRSSRLYVCYCRLDVTLTE